MSEKAIDIEMRRSDLKSMIYKARGQKLVKFLTKKGIDYWYTDNGDFIIQYPELFIKIPDINVGIYMQWESLKQFISMHNQIENIIPVIEALRHIASQDNEVRFINSND